MRSQEDLILYHLEHGNSLTPIDALSLFKTFRLAARIENLRKKGYPIKTIMKETATGKKVAEYKL